MNVGISTERQPTPTLDQLQRQLVFHDEPAVTYTQTNDNH